MVKTLKHTIVDDKQLNVTKIKKTSMNGFGGTSRINHDSSRFYDRKLFDSKEKKTNKQKKKTN